MAYAAMIYNARSEHDARRCPSHQVRYLAGFYDLDALGLQLRREAAQVGWDDAQQQVALTDGGNGLEAFMRRNFPLAQCILDFYHASQHVANLARALHPSDEAAFEQQTQDWCHRLKHQGGAALLTAWEQLDLRAQRGRARGLSPGDPVPAQQPASSRLSDLSGQRLADRLGAGGGRLQTRGGNAAQRQRHAMG